MSLSELIDKIIFIWSVNEISWVMKSILYMFIFTVAITFILLLKYKDSKKKLKDNLEAIKHDFSNLSKIKRTIMIIILVLCIIGIFSISYILRYQSSDIESQPLYDSIALLDENGVVIYPIGIDIIKEEVIDNIIFFTYDVTEKIGDEIITFPVLYKWEKGKLAEKISESACPHFEIIKDSIIYLNSTTMDLSHGELYVARPDGLNERIQEEEVYEFTIDDKYIYYSYCYDTIGAGLEGHALHRMDLNGNNIIMVTYELSSPSLKGNHNTVTVDDGWAIYDNYKVKIGSPATGMEKVVLLDDTDDEWIYYTSNQLIKAKPDGSQQIVLDDTDDFWYQIDKIDDNWIYYQIGNEKFKIDKDGKNKCKIIK